MSTQCYLRGIVTSFIQENSITMEIVNRSTTSNKVVDLKIGLNDRALTNYGHILETDQLAIDQCIRYLQVVYRCYYELTCLRSILYKLCKNSTGCWVIWFFIYISKNLLKFTNQDIHLYINLLMKDSTNILLQLPIPLISAEYGVVWVNGQMYLTDIVTNNNYPIKRNETQYIHPNIVISGREFCSENHRNHPELTANRDFEHSTNYSRLTDQLINDMYSNNIQLNGCDFENEKTLLFDRFVSIIKETNKWFHRRDRITIIVSNSVSSFLYPRSVSEIDKTSNAGILIVKSIDAFTDWDIYFKLDPNKIMNFNVPEGLCICPVCGNQFIIGESGPHLGVTPDCACGYQIATGDHLYSTDLLVLKPASTWISKRSPGIVNNWISLHHMKTIISLYNIDLFELQTYGCFHNTNSAILDYSWRVVQLPTKENTHDCLRTLRMLWAFYGLSKAAYIVRDNIPIVYPINFERAMSFGLPLLNDCGRITFACGGATFYYGSILGAYTESARSLFIKYGETYGLDEVILARHGCASVLDNENQETWWIHERTTFRYFSLLDARGNQTPKLYIWKDLHFSDIIFIMDRQMHIIEDHLVENLPYFEPLNVAQSIQKNFDNGLKTNSFISDFFPSGLIQNSNVLATKNFTSDCKPPAYGAYAINELCYGLRTFEAHTSFYNVRDVLLEPAIFNTFSNADANQNLKNTIMKLTEIVNEIEGEYKDSLVRVCSFQTWWETSYFMETDEFFDLYIVITFNPNLEEQLRIHYPDTLLNLKILVCPAPFNSVVSELVVTQSIFVISDNIQNERTNTYVVDASHRKCYSSYQFLLEQIDLVLTEDIVFLTDNIGLCPEKFLIVGKAGCVSSIQKEFIIANSSFGFVPMYSTCFLMRKQLIPQGVYLPKEKFIKETRVNEYDPLLSPRIFKISNSKIMELTNAKYNLYKFIDHTSNKIYEKITKIGKIINLIPTRHLSLLDRFKTLLNNGVECNYRDYKKKFSLVQDKLYPHDKIINIYVYGTRGDRIPLQAVQKHLISLGFSSIIFYHYDAIVGLADLNICENDKGYFLIRKISKMRECLKLEYKKFLHPHYLGSFENGFKYGLHPLEDEISNLGGGLPRIVDKIVGFFLNKTVLFHFAFTNKMGYLPRSHDGTRFLYQKPYINKVYKHKRGIVLGSSSIKVPKQYGNWPIVPNGDHFEILSDYEVIACAGGAGLVHTAKAAGVKTVITWDDHIDRKWLDSSNAGNLYRENSGRVANDLNIIPLIVHGFSRKNFYNVLKHPYSWMNYLYIYLFKYLNIFQSIWKILFVFYSVRNFVHIDIDFLSTVGKIIVPYRNNVLNGLVVWSLKKTINFYKLANNLSNIEVSKILFLKLLAIINSPVFCVCIKLGFNLYYSIFICVLIQFIIVIFDKAMQNNFEIHKNLNDINPKETSNLYLCFRPIFLNRYVLIGFHSNLFNPSEKVFYEGVHTTSNNMLGSNFELQRQPLTENNNKPFLAFETHLTKNDLNLSFMNSKKYYGLAHNCLTYVLFMISSNLPALGILGGLVLSLNLLWMILAFSILTFSLVTINSCGIVMACVVNKMNLNVNLNAHDLTYKLNSLLMSLTPQFAGEAREEEKEDISHEEDFDIDEQIRLRQELLVYITDAVRQGHDLTDALNSAKLTLIHSLQPSETKIENSEIMELDSSTLAEKINWFYTKLKILNVNSNRFEQILAEHTAFVIKMIQSTIVLNFNFILQIILNLRHMFIVYKCYEGLELIDEMLSTLVMRPLDRTKNIWLPKLKLRNPVGFTFADYLYATLPENLQVIENKKSNVYWDVDLLNRFSPTEDDILPKTVYKRKVYLPYNPRVSKGELSFDSLLKYQAYTIDPRLTERTNKWYEIGKKQLIDGLWLTDSKEGDEAIIRRYVPITRTYTPKEKELMLQSVDALYEKHKECFDNPGIVTPELVLKHLKKKYSAGVPFISRYKTRQNLIDVGWMDNLIEASLYCLESGIYPATVFHSFPKMQIVRKPRTIVAESLLTTFIAQLTQLEVSKRNVWEPTGFGMGMPMTAYNFGKIFTKVNKYKNKFSSDCTEYDSNAPEILFEGLNNLILRGCQNDVKHPAYVISKAKTFSLQHGFIHNLTSGNVFRKNRGGSTGESNTSFDNHWTFRLAMTMALSHSAKVTPKEVLNTSVIYNTGDDCIVGTDLNISKEQITKSFKKLFGLAINVDSDNNIENLSYLHKVPKKLQDLRKEDIVGETENLEFLGVHIPEDIAAKRTAIISRYAGRKEPEFLKSQIKRTIGHALLCPFDSNLYSLLAEDYIEDARLLIGPNNHTKVITKLNPKGHIIAVTIELNNVRRISNQSKALYSYLVKQLKFPSFEEVKNLDYKVYKSPSKFEIGKYSNQVVNKESIVHLTIAVQGVSKMILTYNPDWMVKTLMGKEKVAYMHINPIYTWPVERFIYTSHYKKHKEHMSVNELEFKTRYSMFSSSVDIPGFSTMLSRNDYRKKLENKNEYHKSQGTMIIAFILYILINILSIILMRIPILNLFFSLFNLYRLDFPRLYSTLNSLHWLSSSESSSLLSSMMPKDPYLYQKTLALQLAVLLPDSLLIFISLIFPSFLIRLIVRYIGFAVNFQLIPEVIPNDKPAVKNEFDNHQEEIFNNLPNINEVTVLNAQTGVGKSTKFIATILKLDLTVVLLMPRKLLRKNYENVFFTGSVNKLSQGVRISNERLLVSTYGHILSRLEYIENIIGLEKTIFVLDEIHELNPLMIKTWLALRRIHARILLASATLPENFLANLDYKYLDFSYLTRPFEVISTRMDVPFDQLILSAIKDHGKSKKYLIITTSLNKIEQYGSILTDQGLEWTAVYRGNLNISHHSIIGTQIVDTGINLPEIDVVVDCGKKIISRNGRIMSVYTTSSEEKQRQGRVGRFKTGYYYTIMMSGTSNYETIPPSPLEFLIDQDINTYYTDIGFTHNLVSFDHGNRFFNNYITLNPKFTMKVEIDSAKLWFVLRCLHPEFKEFLQIYLQIYNHGWIEDYEHIQSITQIGMTTLAILSPDEAKRKFDNNKTFFIKLATNQIIGISALKFNDQNKLIWY